MSNSVFLKGGKNNVRRYVGGGPRPDNTSHKRTEAKEREAIWSALSAVDKIIALDRRLGKGVGAVKQRARILAQKTPVRTSEPSSTPTVNMKAKERRAHEQAERPAR